MTTPSDERSTQGGLANMDWVAIRTLRNILQRHLAEVASGAHLQDAKEPASAKSVRSDWKTVVVACTGSLSDLLRLERLDESLHAGDSDISSDDASIRENSLLVRHASLVVHTASAILSSHEDTTKSLSAPKRQDLMASLLKTISGAAGMPLTLWTAGGVITGTTTSLADFFSCAVDHLENKVSGENHGILRLQSARLANTVLPDFVLLATEQGQKIAVRIEDISAWTLGSA